MIVWFDLDGTLIDSRERHKIVLDELLQKNGREQTDLEEYLVYKADGHSTLEYLMSILGIQKGEALQVNRKWIEKIEKKQYLKLDTLYHDTVKSLEFLKDRGIKCYAITLRRNRKLLLDEIECLKISGYFTEVCVISPFGKSGSKYSAAKNEAREEDLVIGDTETDYLLAKKINCNYLMLNRGFRSRNYWNGQHVESYEELFPHLKNYFKYK